MLNDVCSKASIGLICLLPFLVPFSTIQNIQLQGLLLIVAGAFAWCTVILQGQGKGSSASQLRPAYKLLLLVFSIACIVSYAVNPNKTYGFFGAPYIHLGAAGLLACMGCGVMLRRLSTRTFATYIYTIISGAAILSLPYSIVKFHSIERIGGLTAQADIFACFLGVAILLGLYMLQRYPRHKNFLLLNEFFLVTMLVLTGTRAVLLLTVMLSCSWILHSQILKTRLQKVSAASIVLVAFVLGYFILPGRVTDSAYASESIHYRLALQKTAIEASQRKLVWGYGPGNLADALDCSKLSAPPLQKTCAQGYFFNSSHNIFLDRVVALGLLGGIVFVLLVCYSIYCGLRAKPEHRIFVYTAFLIAGYYLTNVTSVTLELLFWIMLVHLAGLPKASCTKYQSKVISKHRR